MCRAMHTLIPLIIAGMSFGIGSTRAEEFPSQCSFPKAAAGKQQKVDSVGWPVWAIRLHTRRKTQPKTTFAPTGPL
jgi:hypothetical protein